MKLPAKVKKFLSRGFSPVELLVIVVILGALSIVVIVTSGPLEKMAQKRDTERKQVIGELANGVRNYYNSKTGNYPVANNSWIISLVNEGKIKSVPSAPTSPLCTTNAQNGWCYTANITPDSALWVRLESSAEKSKCAAGTKPYFAWDSSKNYSCLVCSAGEPAIGAACNANQ